MSRNNDFLLKIDKLRSSFESKGYDGVEIKSQANFSCITRGRGFIGLASTLACGSLLITSNDVFLLSENIEAKRLYVEQLEANPMIKVVEFPWDDRSMRGTIYRDITNGLKIATENELESELFKLRTILSDYDIIDYKNLSYQAASILEEICKGLRPGITEYELAGVISNEFWQANIEPITILVAFDERACLYKHPLMIGNKLRNYALVSVCGRRNGLIVSITRNAMLMADQDILDNHSRCAAVYASFIEKLKVNEKLNNIFLSGIRQYEEVGYPCEYKNHHQGGLTGYVPREMRATADCSHVVSASEAYAFNPTIKNAKCEDTVLVTPDGVEIMTYTGNYVYESIRLNGETYLIPTVLAIS
jgi:hypothetical protein